MVLKGNSHIGDENWTFEEAEIVSEVLIFIEEKLQHKRVVVLKARNISPPSFFHNTDP